MIDNINNDQAKEILARSSLRQPYNSQAPLSGGPDASLQIEYDVLIKNAIKIPQDDTEAIHNAKELLLSGRLNSIAIIQATAGNIADYGI